MALKDLIGQPAAVAGLLTAIGRGAVPQSLLFVGPEGVGKTTAAVEFARALDCRAPQPDGDACGQCVNCTRIAAGEHPDVTRTAPDGEFTRIWQLWTRSGHPPGALETLPFAPVAGRVRFYLIEKAETLNDESANSLLKALEEPPPYVQFVLCAPSPNGVLPTILSRCQVVRFRQIAARTISDALTTRRDLPPDEARVLAAYSEGALGRAFRLADAPELRGQRDALLDLAARIATVPRIAAFRLAEDLRNAAKPAKAKKNDDDADASDRTTRGDLGRALGVLAAWHSDLLERCPARRDRARRPRRPPRRAGSVGGALSSRADRGQHRAPDGLPPPHRPQRQRATRDRGADAAAHSSRPAEAGVKVVSPLMRMRR